MRRETRAIDDKSVSVPELEDFERWQSTLHEVEKYLEVAADFVPHNSSLTRHIGRIRNARLEVTECITRHPDK